MKRKIFCRIALLLALSPFGLSGALAAEKKLSVGVDANYSLDMEKSGATWRWSDKGEDLFRGIRECGVEKLRVRLWAKEEGTNGAKYAIEVVKRATVAGLDPYLVIFLSDDWADLMKQPVPAIWKDLDDTARAAAVRRYSKEMVERFRKEGLRSHLYEIGNEIDYGICGVYPSKHTKKNAESLARRCWPEAVELIKASEAGVREADPEAKFLLHIAHWWDPAFCIGFFRFMLEHGAQVDYAGLSYFPSADIGGSLQMEQFGEVVTKLNVAIARPVIVPETAYPSTSDFKGQFSRWKSAAPGYPLTVEGQRHWLEDFLAYCADHPAIDSVYYWSPEWFGEGMWKAFALFDVTGKARPAWQSFSTANRHPKRKTPVYYEVSEGKLYRVPVDEAKKQAVPVLTEEKKRAGRINVEYIKAITDRSLVVDGYDVRLRASLMGNLELKLSLAAKAAALTDWKGALGRLNPQSESLVLFARDPEQPFVREITQFAGEQGLAISLHPVSTDAWLKFGMGQEWQSEAWGD